MMYLKRQEEILMWSLTSKYATIYFDSLEMVYKSIFYMFRLSVEFLLK